jgi:glycerol-3-phosphate dehydrogenase
VEKSSRTNFKLDGFMSLTTKPHVIIIGAGFTGCATAYDLALRGCEVTVVERGDIANGTSGRTHGLLHSGARYCVNDQEAASECISENITLRRIAKQCIEFNGGLFIALNDEDLNYSKLFTEGAQTCQIPIEHLTPQQALSLEPNLNPKLAAAYTVPDGAFDPLRLALSFAASAKENGAKFSTYCEVVGFLTNGQGTVTGLKIVNRHSNSPQELNGDLVVNATGAWAGHIAQFAKVDVPITPTPGVMVAYGERLINHVVNRLCPPGDGDIIIPQRRMSVIGTTSFEVEDVDYIPVKDEQVRQMRQCAVELLPGLDRVILRGAYMSARPLIGKSEAGRSLSRTFKCYDHKESHGIDGLVTITGGKATTCRIMAEKTADLVCQKLGLQSQCATSELPLSSYRNYYRSNGDEQ